MLDTASGVIDRTGYLRSLGSLHRSRVVCKLGLVDESGIHVIVECRRWCAVKVRVVCDRYLGNSIWCQELKTRELMQDRSEDVRWED